MAFVCRFQDRFGFPLSHDKTRCGTVHNRASGKRGLGGYSEGTGAGSKEEEGCDADHVGIEFFLYVISVFSRDWSLIGNLCCVL
mmetsp:Transcript_3072/g.4433  ORF Transcript_3072/g.4433 Transcript_3072/m.4433 type:complete len:84 (+) Transcript_3072:508-759(+)